MIDSRTALHQAIFRKLNSTVAVTDLADVWSHPEEGTEPTPEKGLVLVGLAGVSDEGDKDESQFDEVTIDIITYIRKPEMTAVYQLSHAIREALQGVAVTDPGALIEPLRFIASDSDLLEDGITYVDTNRYASFVQPWQVVDLFGGAAGYWLDISDEATLFQTGTRVAPGVPVTAIGEPVGLVLDKSGNQSDFTQAAAASRPTYQIDDDGFPYLLFDGVDDFLIGPGGNSLPFDRLSAIRQVGWNSGRRIFSTTNNDAGDLLQRPPSPTLKLNDGAAGDVVLNAGLAIGVNGVVTERHVAGASKLAINKGAYASGNAGSTNPGATTIIGSSSLVGSNPSNIWLYGSIRRAGQLSDADIAQAQVYLGSLMGLDL